MRVSYAAQRKSDGEIVCRFGNVIAAKRAVDRRGPEFRLVRLPDGKILAAHDQRVLKELAAAEAKVQAERDARRGVKRAS